MSDFPRATNTANVATGPAMSWCGKCGGALSMIPCPDPSGLCGVVHMACLACRAVPCDAGCGVRRQPEALYGLCDDCMKGAVQWAAKQWLAAKLRARPSCRLHGLMASDAGRWYCPECAGLPRPEEVPCV